MGLPHLSKLLFTRSALPLPPGSSILYGRTDEHQQAPVPHFLPNGHLSSTVGSPSEKTRCPWLPPVLNLACMVGPRQPIQHVHLMEELPNFFLEGLVSHKLDGRCVHPGVQPWEIMPVIVVKLTFPLPSTPIQQHEQRSFAGWTGRVVYWHPTMGICPGTTPHLGSIPPSPMDNPSFFTLSLVARDLCICPGIAIPVEHGN